MPNTEFLNGWLYDHENKHFAPKSFMSLIYDLNGNTLPQYIENNIFEKQLLIDVSSSSAQTFKDMASDAWPGITGATKNGVAYGNANGSLSFATATKNGQFLMSGTNTPSWHTPTVTLTGDVTASATAFGTDGNVSIATNIADSGVNAGSYGLSTSVEPGYGVKFDVPYITVAADGRITAAATKTVKIPVSDNTDEKVKQSSVTTNAQFPVLLRGTSAGTTNITNHTSFASSILVNPSAGSISATSVNPTNSIEFFPSTTATHGGYIDFHYQGSSADYTSRLIESSSGTIAVEGGFAVNGQATFNNAVVVDSSSYGTSLPDTGVPGQIFFLLIE